MQGTKPARASAVAQQVDGHSAVILRASARTGAVVAQIPNGTEVKILAGEDGEYVEVQVALDGQGHAGWVKRENLKSYHKMALEDEASHLSECALREKGAEVKHFAFSELVATSKLDRPYAIDDPMSERCIEHAREEERMIKDNMMICNDSLFNLNIVPRTSEQRLSSFKTDLGKMEDKPTPWKGEIVRSYGSQNKEFFMQAAGMDDNDATGCIWAISFYTGNFSPDSSRGASLKMRQGNLLLLDESKRAEADKIIDETKMAQYYLVRALCALPAYRGPVVRNVTFSPDKMKKYMQMYKPGNIVKWYQWASSKRGSGSGI